MKSSEALKLNVSCTDDLSQFAKSKLEKLTKDQAFVNTVCTQLLDGYKALFSDLKKDQGGTAEIKLVCKDVLCQIDNLKTDFESTKLSSEETSKFARLNKELGEAHTVLKQELDATKKERDQLRSQAGQVQLELTKAHDANVTFKSEVEKLEIVLKSKESTLKQFDQKIQKCKNTCDSKLRTQMEIHKLIADERDKLKTELEIKVSIISFRKLQVDHTNRLESSNCSA